MKRGIVSVPTSLGASMRGAELGPEAIKEFLDMNSFIDHGTIKMETCPCEDFTKKRFPCIKNNNKRLENKILKVLQTRNFPITLGGDHTLTAGAGVARHYKHIGLFYKDAMVA